MTSDDDRDLGELSGERRRSATMLWLVGTLEGLSLAILLINIPLGDNAAVAQGVGPIHGLLYLAGIALAWSSRLPGRAKAFAVIPGVGTLIAARYPAGIPENRPRPADGADEPAPG